MRVYKFAYKADEDSVTCYAYLTAFNREEAYEKAVYEEIPRIINKIPHKVWISSSFII